MSHDDLLPCPFCNEIEEIRVVENTTSPVMNRPPNVISCDITHWCKQEGLPRRLIKITGRSKAEAITAWNTRTDERAMNEMPLQIWAGYDEGFKQWYKDHDDSELFLDEKMPMARYVQYDHHTAEIEKRDRAIEVLMQAHNRYISDEICDTSIAENAIAEAQAILGDTK